MSETAEIEAAIATLEAQRSVLGEATVAAATAALRVRLGDLQRPQPAPEGEWKQVTILFADISGFTALSESLDAEAVRRTINGCFERMGEAVEPYGGYIDKFIGDEMMVLFGAPRAQEAHASQALYAALEVRDAIARFNRENQGLRDRPLGVHIGLNSGLIVAGAIGTHARRDYTVMGDPVNVAARLVSRAGTGEILVGESTRHLGGHDFDFEGLGEVELKGHRPVAVNRLLRAKYTVPLRGGVNTRVPMLGRESELAMVQEAFLQVAERREPRAVALVGEAGIGKSRLLFEFRTWLQAHYPGALVLQGACYPHLGATPYFVLADMLQNWLGTKRADSGMAVRERLEASLSGIGITDGETVHALAAVLAIEYEDDQLRELLPEERRQRIFASFLTLCERISARGPLLVQVEDVHWADELSLDILGLLARQTADPMLLVVLSRPVSDPAAEARQIESWMANAGYACLRLKALDGGAMGDLVSALAPGLPHHLQASRGFPWCSSRAETARRR